MYEETFPDRAGVRCCKYFRSLVHGSKISAGFFAAHAETGPVLSPGAGQADSNVRQCKLAHCTVLVSRWLRTDSDRMECPVSEKGEFW
jgi:hypothetical protein